MIVYCMWRVYLYVMVSWIMSTRISVLRLVLLQQYTGSVFSFEGAIPPRQQIGDSICIIEPIKTCLLLYSISIPLDPLLHFTSLRCTPLIFLLSNTSRETTVYETHLLVLGIVGWIDRTPTSSATCKGQNGEKLTWVAWRATFPGWDRYRSF